MDLQRVAQFITDFADQAVILPLMLCVAAALVASGRRREAMVWGLATCGALGLTLLLKLGFSACGHLVLAGQIQSPSGHTAAAGVVYGGILGFISRRSSWHRHFAVAVVILVVVTIGASRVFLGAHTMAEVTLGALVGVGAAFIVIRQPGAPISHHKLALGLLPCAAVVLLFHGLHLPAEAAIQGSNVWPLSACRK